MHAHPRSRPTSLSLSLAYAHMSTVLKKLLSRFSLSSSSAISFSSRAKKAADCCSSVSCVQRSHGDGAPCSYERLHGEGSRGSCNALAKKQKVPRGCVPVVVNGEHRLLLKASHLSQPFLTSLLQQTAQEMGYTWQYTGALRLSCDPASFHHLLRLAITP